jgi:hypothetical protein
VGLLPQQIFPGLVGLYTFVVGRYNAELQRSLQAFFDWREKVPRFLRIVAVILIPMVISLIITYQERVSQTALKEQFVVIISLVLGYLMLAPRGGDLVGGFRQMVSEFRSQQGSIT